MRSLSHRCGLFVCVCAVLSCCGLSQAAAQEGADVVLPEGVKAVWDVAKAYRETTPTRERICINGLWQFRPSASDDEPVLPPDTGWGYFKVPGTWPLGAGRRETGPSQRIFAPDGWSENLADVDAAWYAREIAVPQQWQGRRITVQAAWVNSYAQVFVDGVRASDIVFPGGEADITDLCTPGQTHQLAIHLFGRRLTTDGTSFVTPDAPGGRRRGIGRRGLCGDVFLSSTSQGACVTDVSVDTSVRRRTLTIAATPKGLEEGKSYVLQARVTDGGEEVLRGESDPFTSDDLRNGRQAFSIEWRTPRLWDLDTPQNQYHLAVELLEGDAVVDAYYPVRFGFREFWIEGRDFYLNGSRVHLIATPLNSAQNDTATASYEGARETFRRLKRMGYNAAYTHNYSCPPGAHLAFEGILRAADDEGMLLSFSLPHMREYDWQGEEPEKRNGYERHLEWYVRCAQNHPSVVMYSQNHNWLSYQDDENPERMPLVMDSLLGEAQAEQISQVYAREAILRRLDSARPQYNHSGPSREMYTMNCYLNWAPMQERSDWFQRWSEYGARPLYLVEYGEPLIFSFSSNRGRRGRGRQGPPQQNFYTEWGAQLRGPAAFDLSEFEKANLRLESLRFRNERSPGGPLYAAAGNRRDDIPNLRGVQAEFIKWTWPAFRTLGLSGFNIWHEGNLCRFGDGAEASRRELPADWDNLQRPGYTPDFYSPRTSDSWPYSLGTKMEDWVPNVRGAAFRRYSQPLLAYIAGGPEHFTGRAHNYLAGQAVEKQIIVINDSRRPVECACEWSANLPNGPSGLSTVRVEPGENERVLVSFTIPPGQRPGAFELKLKATFSTGEVQEDAFTVDVLAPPSLPRAGGKVALYDPHGETAELLRQLGVPFDAVQADAELGVYDVLVIGKGALTVDGPAPDLLGVRDGLRAVVFEQNALALERRLGFRVQEQGLRRVFVRAPGHPILAGLSDENLHDWQGEATLLPANMPLGNPNSYPMAQWCGFTVSRPGRAGCWGNVSSVLIERPAAGDFLPLVEGGFALQYSPLMVYREGKGIVVFCQMDVTGRSADEPAAARLAANILDYVSSYRPPSPRSALYAGAPEGLAHLMKAGAEIAPYTGQPLTDDSALVLGPGAAAELGDRAGRVAAWVKGGGHVLALGLRQEDVRDALGLRVRLEEAEYISSFFPPPGARSLLAGVGCSDLMTRDPRTVPLVTGGAPALGGGVLAQSEGENAVFLQIVPWQFNYEEFYNTKLAFRHTSFVVSRLLGNLGVPLNSPLLERFGSPLVLPPQPPKTVLGKLRITCGNEAVLLPTQWQGMALLSGEAPDGWTAAGFDDSRWHGVKVGASWESQFEELRSFDGAFLYRVKVRVPPELAGRRGTLVLGAVDDEDRTYVNGSLVGSTTQQTNPADYWEVPRRYDLPAGTLEAGENVIAVEVTDVRQAGGIMAFASIEDVPPVRTGPENMRWLTGLYLDEPVAEDDPYRFYRW